MYERLLVRGVATNARHAFGLAALAAATYTLIEHLAAVADDETTRSLAERCRREIEPLAQRWTTSWDAVLDLDSAQARADGHETMLMLLEDAHAMERMRVSLLTVAASHARGAGVEQAGLGHLAALIDHERTAATHDRDLLHDRLAQLRHHAPVMHAIETFAAARAAALIEQIRSYKLVRDIRDVLAADRLETATYDLLARAAERAGDTSTAQLARQLRAAERAATERLAKELDTALEIALLAE